MTLMILINLFDTVLPHNNVPYAAVSRQEHSFNAPLNQLGIGEVISVTNSVD